MTLYVNKRPPRIAVGGRIRLRPSIWLVFAVTVLVAAACGSDEPQASPTEASPRVVRTAGANGTEIPPLPLPTLRPIPSATPLPETCDPVQRAHLSVFEGVALPPVALIFDSIRFIDLPPAWVIADGVAVFGSSGAFSCNPPDSGPFPCPDNPDLKCHKAAPLHGDFTPDIGAPRDHSRVVSAGSLGGRSFAVLVDSAAVEFFASTLVIWTDETRSGFDPSATRLSPHAITADGATLYEYPALPELTPGADYLLTVRLEFAGDNEINYRWRVPG